MRLFDRYDGGGDPFEGDRTIVWRSLPVNAVVTKATLTLAALLPPGARTFVERLRFGATGPAYGATIDPNGSGVLIDFHARRTALRIDGLATIAAKSLSVDIGGGVFLAVGADGTIPAQPNSFFNFNSGVLPGVTAQRMRLADATLPPDLSAVSVGIATMPANLTLRFGKLLPFFSKTGDLALPVTTPDITAAVQRALGDAAIVDGYYAIPLVVHSDTLGRLSVTLDVCYLGAAPLMPAGLREVVLPFDLASVTTTDPSALQAILPAGAVARSPQTALAVRGAFDASRVAYGPTGSTLEAAPLRCSADATIAQKLQPVEDLTVSGVDLFVAAEGPAARLALDLRADADGKPGTVSLLPKPATLDLAGDPTGRRRWVTAPLKPPALLSGGTRYWLVVQAIDGAAQLGAFAAADPALTPQRSSDAGFSWRGSGASPPVLLRLREVPDRFHMPIDFVAGTGPQAVRVSLAAYDPLGKIDAVLDRPEIAGAVQSYIAKSAPAPCATGEVLRNPQFVEWAAQGDVLAVLPPVPTAPSGPPPGELATATPGYEVLLLETFLDQPGARLLEGEAVPSALAFSADGALLFVVQQGGVKAVNPSDGSFRDLGVPLHPLALLADPLGGGLLAADGTGLQAIDPVTGQSQLVAPLAGAMAMAMAPDGTVAYVVGSGEIAAVDLRTRTPRYRFTLATPGKSIAVSPDGASLAAIDQSALRVVTIDAATGAPGWIASLPSGQMPQAVAFAADGSGVYLVADARSTPPGGTVPATTNGSALTLFAYDANGRQRDVLPLGVSTGGVAAIAVKPQGDRVYVAGTPLALDPGGGRLAVGVNGAAVGVVAVGVRRPSGWTLTAGQVEPVALPDFFAAGAAPPDDPGRIAALVTEGALSQVCPVAETCRHDLSVAAITPQRLARSTAEAVAEIFWYDAAGAFLHADALPVPAANIVVTQRRRLTPPSGSAQAEIRVSVTGGFCAFDEVSLVATDALLQDDAWQPDPTLPARLVASSDASGIVWRNLGASDGALTQSATLSSAAPLELGFRGAVVSGQPALSIGFLDTGGALIGSLAEVVLEARAFEQQSAQLLPPPGAAIASARILLPAGSALRVVQLALTARPAATVPCGFIAQAPGELHVSTASIVYDIASGPAPAPPAAGLVAPTPPGGTPGAGGADCCCAEPAPGTLAHTLRPLPENLRIDRPPAQARPPVRQAAAMWREAAVWPKAPVRGMPPAGVPTLEDIPGVGAARNRRLNAAGIATVADLASATPEQVNAALAGPATTLALAASLVERARALLAARTAGSGG